MQNMNTYGITQKLQISKWVPATKQNTFRPIKNNSNKQIPYFDATKTQEQKVDEKSAKSRKAIWNTQYINGIVKISVQLYRKQIYKFKTVKKQIVKSF